MFPILRVILITFIGILTGTLVWSLFFLAIGNLVDLMGGLNIQPIFSSVKVSNLLFPLGFQKDAIHGFLTGLAIVFFLLKTLEGGFCGFVVTQLFFLILLILLFNEFMGCSKIDSVFGCVVGNVIETFFMWLIYITFLFFPSLSTGFIIGKTNSLLLKQN